MPVYFIHNGKEQEGPFSIEDLKNKNISRKTLMWCEGMSEWRHADQIEEVKHLFAQSPPPLSQSTPQHQMQVNKSVVKADIKKTLTWIILIIVVIAGGILIWQNQQSNSNSYNPSDNDEGRYAHPKTPAEIRNELMQKESESPEEYLIAKGTFRKNLIDEMVLEGTIENTATIASFKDIVIEAEYLAASGTSLGSERFTRYEILGPGYDVTFKFKTYAPKETKSVSISVESAKPVY